MNVIGKVGNFIVNYQEPIQICVIVVFAALGIFVLYKLIASARQKRSWLKEIHENVSELNASVKTLGEKKTEVIYIDGRVTPESRGIDAEPVMRNRTNGETAVSAQTETGTAREMQQNFEERPCPTLKYHSRDCGVSKDGRKYTIEELDAQIKD